MSDRHKGPTKRMLRVYEFIKLYRTKYGYAPSRQEIAEAFDWSSANAAQQVLQALQHYGYLRIAAGKVSRGLMLLK